MMRRRPRMGRLAAGVTVVTLVALAGCGVPVDRGPSALPRHGIPFDLLQPSTRSTTTTSIPSPLETPVQIFLATSSGHLFPVTRKVPAPQESLAAAVLGALVKGPTNAEAAAGLESSVPPQTVVLGAVISTDGVATVNLAGTFGQLVGQTQIEAVAQIVFTVTSLPGVTDVTFELASLAVDVPTASGAEVPVANRLQFAALAPLPAASAGG